MVGGKVNGKGADEAISHKQPPPTDRNVQSLRGIRWMAVAHGNRSGQPVTRAWILTQKSMFFCVRKPMETSEKNLKTRWLVVSAAMVGVGVHSEHLAPENPHIRHWNAVADGTEFAPTTTGTRIITIGKLP